MKKRITVAAIIAAMTMSIMACGGKTQETQAPASTQTETVVVTEAATEAPETEAETEKVDNEVGHYRIDSMTTGAGEEYDSDALEVLGATDENTYLDINADGTVDLSVCDEKMSGTWSKENEEIVLGDITYSYSYYLGFITFSSDEGMYTFDKSTTVEAETEASTLTVTDESEKGDGTMYISTPSGTSEGGNVPVLFENSDTTLVQIGLDTVDMDGSHLSYIYVDSNFVGKQQLADSQTVLDLEKDMLSVGTHTVALAQYDTDSEGGNIITYKAASYEVKSK